MSWLLVAFVPGLLILATLGLARLEAGLVDGTVSPEDVAEFLEQAKADCAKPALRTHDRVAYELVDDTSAEHLVGRSAEGLPARVFIHHGPNPEFQPTRQAYRV